MSFSPQDRTAAASIIQPAGPPPAAGAAVQPGPALPFPRGASKAGPGLDFSLDDLPARIKDRVTVDPDSGCWIWGGTLTEKGYGCISWDGRLRRVHRVVYMLLVGPIPGDRPQLDHVRDWGCTSRACCFPGHLEPVTNRENSLRGWRARCGPDYQPTPRSRGPRKPRVPSERCKRGHKYTPANTILRRNGTRDCRKCAQMYEKKRRVNPDIGHPSTWTRCTRGHEFTEANTYIRPNGRRACRACIRRRRSASRRNQAVANA